MATELPNELETFRKFINQELATSSVSSVDELWIKYQEYRSELAKFRAELDQSIAEADRGDAKPLDIDAFKAEITKKLAEKGITD